MYVQTMAQSMGTKHGVDATYTQPVAGEADKPGGNTVWKSYSWLEKNKREGMVGGETNGS